MYGFSFTSYWGDGVIDEDWHVWPDFYDGEREALAQRDAFLSDRFSGHGLLAWQVDFIDWDDDAFNRFDRDVIDQNLWFPSDAGAIRVVRSWSWVVAESDAEHAEWLRAMAHLVGWREALAAVDPDRADSGVER